MLTTVEAVVDAIGGTSKVAELTGVTMPAVSNWKARGRFPAEKYLIFSDALKTCGAAADPALFGFETSEARA